MYPAVVHRSYINTGWSLSEFKDEMKKEINSVHAHKQCDYITGSSCVSAPSSDAVVSTFYTHTTDIYSCVTKTINFTAALMKLFMMLELDTDLLTHV